MTDQNIIGNTYYPSREMNVNGDLSIHFDFYQTISTIDLQNIGDATVFPVILESNVDDQIYMGFSNPYTSENDPTMVFNSQHTEVLSFSNDDDVRFPIIQQVDNTFYAPQNYAHTTSTGMGGTTVYTGCFENNKSLTIGYVPRGQTGKNLFKNSSITMAIVECGELPEGTLEGCADLQFIYLFNVNTLIGSPFDGCYGIKTIYFPKLLTLGELTLKGMFQRPVMDGETVVIPAKGITIIDLPNVTSINIHSFDEFCSILQKIKLPKLLEIPNGMFATRTYSEVSITFPVLQYCILKSLTALPTDNFDTAISALVSLQIPFVTTVPANAFQNYVKLQQIFINSATSIGANSFNGCTVLTQISMNSATSIGDNAFNTCSALIHFNGPSVTTLGSNVFLSSFALQTIYLDEITSMGTNTFGVATPEAEDPVLVPGTTSYNLNIVSMQKLTSIPTNAFLNCTNLQYIIFPKVVTLGDTSFSQCSGLTTIDFSIVETTGTDTFKDCDNITTLYLNKVTSLPNGFATLFLNNTHLTYISMNQFAGDLLDNMFEGCTALTTILVGAVTGIGEKTFANCTSLISLQSGMFDQVSTLGQLAFLSTGLVNIQLPGLLTVSAAWGGHNSFYNCAALETLNLGQITDILSWKFGTETPALKSLTATHLTTLPAEMLKDCTNLQRAQFNAATVLGSDVFKNCTGLLSIELMGLIANGTTTFAPLNLFTGCSALTTLKFGRYFTSFKLSGSAANVPMVGQIPNLESLTADYVTIIPDSLFEGSTKLKCANFPSVILLGDDVFKGCVDLTSSILASGITPSYDEGSDQAVCGDNIFQGCVNLLTVNMDNFVTVGTSLFTGCIKLNQVVMRQLIQIPTGGLGMPLTNLKTIYLDKITSLPDQIFKDSTKLTNITIPKVLSIGESSFENCSALATITLNSVTSMENNAFKGCSNLIQILGLDYTATGVTGSSPYYEGIMYMTINEITTSIVINPTGAETLPLRQIILGDYAFQNCSKLNNIKFDYIINTGISAFENTGFTNLTLSQHMLYTGEAQFKNCTKLQSATGQNVQFLSNDTFRGCSLLTTTTLPSLLNIGSQAFYNCIVLTTINLTDINYFGDSALYGCSALTQNIIANDCYDMGTAVFENCSNLTSVETNTAALPNNTFKGCSKLSVATLSQVANIGTDAFSGCGALSSISIPLISSLGDNIFQNCRNLATVVVANLTSIGEKTFENCSSLHTLNLSSLIQTGKEAFSGCSLFNVDNTPLTNLLKIDERTFKSCSALQYINAPLSQVVGEMAFADCGLLQSVIIGDYNNTSTYSSTNYGIDLFYGCRALKYIEILLATNLPTQFLEECQNLETFKGNLLENQAPLSNTGTYYNLFRDAKKLINVEMNALTIMPDNLLQQQTGLINIQFSNLVQICQSAFQGCTVLTTAQLPNVVKLWHDAFYNCTSLTTVNLPKCITLGQSVFYGCRRLSSLILAIAGFTLPDYTDAITGTDYMYQNQIGDRSFSGCLALTSPNIGFFTQLGNECFMNCTGLIHPIFQNIIILKDKVFSGCNSITSLQFPLCTTIYDNVFSNCTSMTSLELPLITRLETNALNGNLLALTQLIINPIGRYETRIFGASTPSRLRTILLQYPLAFSGTVILLAVIRQIILYFTNKTQTISTYDETLKRFTITF